MAGLVNFLKPIFSDGAVLLREPPRELAADREPAAGFLEEVFAVYRLEVAGPLVIFDRKAALSAADWLWRACWYLVDRRDPPEQVAKALPEPWEPATAGQHLSADLLLRYLPQIQRRARAAAAVDVLLDWLARVLQRWPLSGVLADLSEGPSREPALAGHFGLQQLYAERLAAHPRLTWVPSGAAREMVDLVFFERGLTVPVPPAARSTM